MVDKGRLESDGLPARFLDRLDHVGIGPAPAKITGATPLDFINGGLGSFLQQHGRGHDEAGRTEAAHERIALDESLLHRRELPVLAEPLDGGDFDALGIDRQLHAGVGQHAIDQHGTGTAGRTVADFLGAGERGVIAQRVEQRDAGLKLEVLFFTVDLQGDGHRAGALRSRPGALGDFIRDRPGLDGGDGDGAGTDTFEEGTAVDGGEIGGFAHENQGFIGVGP